MKRPVQSCRFGIERLPTALLFLLALLLVSNDMQAEKVRTVYGRPQIANYALADLTWVPRTLEERPDFASDNVRYCIWVLGDGRKSVMTMAWDESEGTGTGYDTLYVDRDFDRDLTDREEYHVWNNIPKKTRGTPFEQYDVRNVKEADGDKVFHFKFRNVYSSDEIEYNSTYEVRSPTLSYDVGPLPGNHKILWSNDLKTAPVYHFGGDAVPVTNGKMPGEPMGTWQAGRTVGASITTVHFGDRPEAQLRFYGSKFPGLKAARRGARWGTACYPLVYLRVLDGDGSIREEIRFGDSCPCAGGFAPQLLIPSRVPPGPHELVVRMLRVTALGGVADFVYPVEIENPSYGQPLKDPAYLALKAKLGGVDAKFASLRRADEAAGAAGSRSDEFVVPTRVFDNTMEPSNRDWDPRPVNYGAERLLAIGTKPHCHGDSRTLLKFDLSGIPTETEILGAQLRLTLVAGAYISFEPGAKLNAYAVRRRWNERREPDGWSAWHGPLWFGRSGAKWGKAGCDDTKVDRCPEPAGSADIGGFPQKIDPNDASREAPRELRRVISLDLGELVREWHGGQVPNHGILLKIAGKGNGRICSSEFLEYPFRPALVAAYRGASPEPTYHIPPGEDLAYAKAEAQRRNVPLAAIVYSPRCVVCKKADATTFADAKVKSVLSAFQTVRINYDQSQRLSAELGVADVPAVVILDSDGETVLCVVESGTLAEPEVFVSALAGLGGE